MVDARALLSSGVGWCAVEPFLCPILRFSPPQEHQNEDLYEKAVSILETYFECEEGDDQNLAPQMAGNQYAFGQQAAQVSRGEGVVGLLLGGHAACWHIREWVAGVHLDQRWYL